MSDSKRVLVRDDEGCCQIVPLNRKKMPFSQKNVGASNPSSSSDVIDYSIIRDIVREEVRSILREELSKMFENFKK